MGNEDVLSSDSVFVVQFVVVVQFINCIIEVKIDMLDLCIDLFGGDVILVDLLKFLVE